MKKEFLLGLLCLISQLVCAQSLPKIIPQSPNAAVLGKFGDVPVSQYTGSANISIPLYTIQSGDISLPISLDYHTGGIRINELAGWTGLGWALSSGGVISRSKMGLDDINSTMFPEIVTKGQVGGAPGKPQTAINEISADSRWLHSIVTTKNETYDFMPVMNSLDGYDHEYDIFNYNFPGKSGRFILTNADQAIIEKKDDIEITLLPSSTDRKFKIRDEKGFIYYFNDIEKATLDPNVGTYISSWYLTKIESPKGDSIKFLYQQTSQLVVGQNIQSENFGCNAGFSNSFVTTSFNQTLILNKIFFNQGYVEFTNDTDRLDYSGKKVTGVKVFSNTSAIPIKEYSFTYSYFLENLNYPGKIYKRLRLDKVTEKSGTAQLPSHQFTYNNFDNDGGADIYSFNTDHWGYYNGYTNTTSLPKFIGHIETQSAGSPPQFLNYNMIELAGANKEPNPAYSKIFSLKEIKYPTGGKTVLETEANTYEYDMAEMQRGPMPEYVRRDTILTFPARGDTYGQLDFISPVNVSDLAAKISFVCTDSVNRKKFQDPIYYPAGSIFFEFYGNMRDMTGNLMNCGGLQCQWNTTVPPFTAVNYRAHISTNVPSQFVWISLSLTWYETLYKSTSNKNKFRYTGGLRIKKITNYDASGNVISAKSYDYHYMADVNGDGIQEEHSKGKRMSLPFYWRYFSDAISGPGGIYQYCPTFQRFSNSIAPLGPTACYDQVTESFLDNSGVDGIGKSVYTFINKQDSLYSYKMNEIYAPYLVQYGGYQPGYQPGYQNLRPSGMANLSYKLNGSLLSKVDYKKSGSTYVPVHESRSEYSSVLLNNYFSIKTETLLSNGSDVYLIYAYPVIRNERILLTKTSEIIYNPLDITKFTITDDTFTYGTNHEQSIQHTITGSNGVVNLEKKVYPLDYGTLSLPTYGIKNLVDKHIIGSPIEQYSIVQANAGAAQYVMSASMTTYNMTNPFPDKVYVLETSSPILLSNFNWSNKTVNNISLESRYKPRVFFLQYDSRGNIERVSKSDDVNLAYVWSYDGAMPIAEVKNVTDNIDVAYTSFEASSATSSSQWIYSGTPITAPDSNPLPTGKKCYAITNALSISKIGLTSSKSYVLSFWVYTAGTGTVPTLSVGTPTAGRNKNGWTYYEKVFTGATSLLINGVGTIDDLKLYPVGSQMTTYAYDPLIGVTTVTDANNLMTYYEYDQFNRLKFIKNDKGKILKSYQYNYKDQK